MLSPAHYHEQMFATVFYIEKHYGIHLDTVGDICLLSDLTGSKFSGNGSALISLPHTTHRHLVTCTRAQNLWNKKNMDSSVGLISLHGCYDCLCFYLQTQTSGRF